MVKEANVFNVIAKKNIRILRENQELHGSEYHVDNSKGNGSYKQVPRVFWSYLYKSLSDIYMDTCICIKEKRIIKENNVS